MNQDNSPIQPQTEVAERANPEEEHALRWRRAILRLSETFMDAADERRDLSPILLEAMHNALDNLLVYGEAGDLMVLEEWLSMEEETKEAAWRKRRASLDRRDHDRRFADRRHKDSHKGRRENQIEVETDGRLIDRRLLERRSNDRRTNDRREPRDWHFEEIQTNIVEL